jgi:hypothetical protein
VTSEPSNFRLVTLIGLSDRDVTQRLSMVSYMGILTKPKVVLKCKQDWFRPVLRTAQFALVLQNLMALQKITFMLSKKQ